MNKARVRLALGAILRPAGAIIALSAGLLVSGQKVSLTLQEYDQHKAAGTLPEAFEVKVPEYTPKPAQHPPGTLKGGGGGGFIICDPWIQPDGTYTLAMPPNDDLSSSFIPLPFQFTLYGDLYSGLYINNNGNVSFTAPYGTYSAIPFPTTDFVMIAPFWADLDTRGDDGLGLNGGEVWYKVTSTAIYVNWVDVGYYGMHTDKKVWVQLILTDGTDPIIGVGNNVAFTYLDMQWTTGDASCFGGIDPCSNALGDFSCSNSGGFGYGFCGIPAVVGANRGDGIDYIQFGTFDRPGVTYDGPFGNVDEVDWLDYKNFVLTTAVSTQNIPPIPSSSLLCDTLVICTGELVDIEMSFIAPESGQVVNATSTALSLSNYTELSNTSGSLNAVITSQFQPTISEVGFHNIHFEAIDDGVPPLTTIVDIVVDVVLAPSGPPVITGDSVGCAGVGVTLTASGGFDNYIWSNGYTGQAVLVGGGIYTVTAGAGSCVLTSEPFTVTESPNPDPVITGVLVNCGGEPTELGTTLPYASYSWSNGATTPTTTVGTGTYSVVVTDANGCTGASATVNVISSDDPSAFFTTDPPLNGMPGSDMDFLDGSNGNGGTIVSWSWDFGNGQTSDLQNPVISYDLPGVYTVTLTVTTADGCTDTYILTIIIGTVDIVVPNVFSPNEDDHNDALEFTNLEFYPHSALKVYSRWGHIVYESANYTNNWKARDVSEGTYYYELKLSDNRVFTGHVTLVR